MRKYAHILSKQKYLDIPDEKKIYKAAIENGFKKMTKNANGLIEKKIISKEELIALTRSIEY